MIDYFTGVLPSPLVAATRSTGRVNVVVTNNGTTTANGVLGIQLYLSVGTSLIAGNLPLSPFNVPVHIKPGGVQTFKVPIGRVPVLAFGTYHVLAQINPKGKIVESNLSNDAAVSAGTLNVVLPVVDLAASIAKVPSSIRAGRSGMAQMDLTNTGNIPAVGVVTIALTAPTSATTGPSDLSIRTFKRHVAIGAGKNSRLSVAITIPKDFPHGPYYLAAQITYKGPVLDSNPANDSAISTVTFTVTA